MNLVQLKYVVETARVGSMSKAAKNLYVAQPNLSRNIRELEKELGITVFIRSANGIELTGAGTEFISYAKDIVSKAENIENYYKVRHPVERQFSICVPRSGYVSDAFVKFSNELSGDGFELYYKETDTYDAMKKVIDGDCNLGIIRYDSRYDNYFRTMLTEKGLTCTDVNTFRYKIAVSRENRLAGHATVSHSDLHGLYEIAHKNSFFSEFPLSIVQEKESHRDTSNRIYVFDRSSQFELLSGNPKTYMWVSPMPSSVLEKYNLVLIDCPQNDNVYYDVLINRNDRGLSPLDRRFVEILKESI